MTNPAVRLRRCSRSSQPTMTNPTQDGAAIPHDAGHTRFRGRPPGGGRAGVTGPGRRIVRGGVLARLVCLGRGHSRLAGWRPSWWSGQTIVGGADVGAHVARIIFNAEPDVRS